MLSLPQEISLEKQKWRQRNNLAARNTSRSNAKDPSPDLSPEAEEDSVYDSDAVYGREDEFEVQGSSDEDGDLLEEQGKDDHDDSLDGGLQSV